MNKGIMDMIRHSPDGRIVVLEKGRVVKDMVTTPETLKELESMFAAS